MIIDFCSPALHQQVKETGKNSLLARALGLKKVPLQATLWDLTAGLGKDAFILASLGFQVILFERNPQVSDALRQALNEVKPDTWSYSIVSRLNLIAGDALAYLKVGFLPDPLLTLPEPAAIYLDPMFPLKHKKALSPKPMQLLQNLVGEDQDADELLEHCLSRFACRVAVKRHRLSPYLANKTPVASLLGKSHRFDVYQGKLTLP